MLTPLIKAYEGWPSLQHAAVCVTNEGPLLVVGVHG
jgi:hypothetical protein